MENALMLIILLTPIVAILGVAAFVGDHWDDSGKTLSSWFLTGFPSPWRYALRVYWCRRFHGMPQNFKDLLYSLGTDPEALILKGEL